MHCPHVDAALRVIATKGGDILCPECYNALGVPADKKLYTGKKVWSGTQVDGQDKNKEKIAAFGEKIAERAAVNRRRFSEPRNPVVRKRLGFSE